MIIYQNLHWRWNKAVRQKRPGSSDTFKPMYKREWMPQMTVIITYERVYSAFHIIFHCQINGQRPNEWPEIAQDDKYKFIFFKYYQINKKSAKE